MPTGFREIASELRLAIERGDYPAGARIPTESQLAEQHGVSRETVRRALALLKSDGLLTTATSQGTFVHLLPVRLAIARYTTVCTPDRERSDLGPWETACAEHGIDGRTEVLAVEREVVTDQRLADRLDVPSGAELVHRTRQMWASDQIAQVQDSWIPAQLAEGTPLAEAEKVVGGVYAVMTAGFGPVNATEEVTARMPTSDERDRMNLTEGVPVLEIWRTTRDATGRIIEVLRTVANAHLSTLLYENLPVGQSPR